MVLGHCELADLNRQPLLTSASSLPSWESNPNMPPTFTPTWSISPSSLHPNLDKLLYVVYGKCWSKTYQYKVSASLWNHCSRLKRLSGRRIETIRFLGMQDDTRYERGWYVAGRNGRLDRRISKEGRNGWRLFMPGICRHLQTPSNLIRTSTLSLGRSHTDSISRITAFLGLWIRSWLHWLELWYRICH